MAGVPEKQCVGCGAVKPLDAFKNRSGSPDGKRNDCRVCSGERERVRREKPEAKARILSAQRDRRKRNYDPRIARHWNLKSKFNIGLPEYEAMLAAQRGVCAICGGVGDPLCVDHCHESGAIRGLLCSGCNTGIGMLGDDPVRVLAAVTYLRKHKETRWQTDMAGTGNPPTLHQSPVQAA